MTNLSRPKMQGLLFPVMFVYFLVFSSSDVFAQVCEPGKFLNTLTSLCEDCKEGTFQSISGQIKCDDCPAGKYQDQTGQVMCKDCLPGTYSNKPGSEQCIPCDIGTYQDLSRAASCKPCEEGFYQDQVSAIDCKQCAEGYTSPKGSTSITDCVLNNQPGSVDITGKASVGFMLRSNYADDIVVRRPDGTFGYRELSTIKDDDSDSANELQTLSQVLSRDSSAAGMRIKNLKNPVDAQDAVTKAYVDILESRIFELEYSLGKDSISDIDGNYYKVIKIGTQYWMAENLRTTRYRDGSVIDSANNVTRWTSNPTNGKWCWYDGDSATYEVLYGKLYNWHAVNDSRGLCPSGWHVPSNDSVGEWLALRNFLEPDEGLKMKTTYGWDDYNMNSGNGNNSSGFSGLPGGQRNDDGSFSYIGELGNWWTSSTEITYDEPWFRFLSNSRNHLLAEFYHPKEMGLSVRCIKD